MLTERAVRSAIAELVELGELLVDYNAGPGGVNRYRVITSGADSAPGNFCPPAESAPGQGSPGFTSSQVNGRYPAETAPPASSAPGQSLPGGGADIAPGTRKEPPLNSSTKSSQGGAGGGALFDAPGAAATPKRRKRRTQGTNDPRFEIWYAAYPVHKARGDAERAWDEVMATGADPDVLTAAATTYCRDPYVLRGYGKNPATWLRAKCWLDEPTPQQQPGGGNGHSPAANQRGGARQRLATAEEAARLTAKDIV